MTITASDPSRIRFSDPGGTELVVEVSFGLRALRDFRSLLLEVLTNCASEPGAQFILLLIDSAISEERLDIELLAAARVVTPEVASRAAIAVVRDGEVTLARALGEQNWLTDEVRRRLSEIRPERTVEVARPHSAEIVTRHLVARYLQKLGGISRHDLSVAVGYSAVTLAKALGRLGKYLTTDRRGRLQLAAFPADPWLEMVSKSEAVRRPLAFVDVSGQPRSFDYLRGRLTEVFGHRAAFGGTLGAAYWDQELDLVGTPRLDVSVHAPDGVMHAEWMQKVDPGLQPTLSRDMMPRVVLHGVFDKGWSPAWDARQGIPVADPAECLLDLTELRLADQATAFVTRILSR